MDVDESAPSHAPATCLIPILEEGRGEMMEVLSTEAVKGAQKEAEEKVREEAAEDSWQVVEEVRVVQEKGVA